MEDRGQENPSCRISAIRALFRYPRHYAHRELRFRQAYNLFSHGIASQINRARAISISEKLNSGDEPLGISHSSSIEAFSVSCPMPESDRNSSLPIFMASPPHGGCMSSPLPSWRRKLQVLDLALWEA